MKELGMGLFLKGLIMNKTTFTMKNGEKQYNLHIAAPGLSGNVQVGVGLQRFNEAALMQEYAKAISFSEYKGKTYFQEV